MKIFEPLVAEGYEWVNACDDGDYEVFRSFDGRPRKAGWKPIRVRRVRADDRQDFKCSDFPWLGSHALVLRNAAVDALRDLWTANGELLPLIDIDGVDPSVFNARVVDALDESRSSLATFPGSNRIMRIERHVFLPDVVEQLDIFRLPHRASSTYVSERFVDRTRAARLHGLDFNVVWQI